MKPIKVTKEELLKLIKNLEMAVTADDSFDGSIEYHATEERGVFEVTSTLRHGNKMGQGWMLVVGDTSEDTEAS